MNHTQQRRSRRSAVEINTMELMLYVDTGVITSRGGNTAATNYALSIMNIVSYTIHKLRTYVSSYVSFTDIHSYNIENKFQWL